MCLVQVPHPRQVGVVRALLEGGASPAMANRQGASALALAAGLGLWRELALLLRHAVPRDGEDAAALEASHPPPPLVPSGHAASLNPY